MTERPIIFTAPMVRAILEGRKTQTRRVLKPQPSGAPMIYEIGPDGVYLDYGSLRAETIPLPAAPGDLLWVKEAWRTEARHDKRPPSEIKFGYFQYRADNAVRCMSMREQLGWGRWRSPIHMPRWVSRITLRVTEVRVQRVQDISREDCESEGCPGWYSPQHPDFGETDGRLPEEDFADLWDSINAKRGFGWDANPWVAAITFEKMGE